MQQFSGENDITNVESYSKLQWKHEKLRRKIEIKLLVDKLKEDKDIVNKLLTTRQVSDRGVESPS